ITQGMDAVSPLCTYPVVCARILDMDFINQGVGGYVFDAGSLDENFPFEPDIIIVAYGVNDWNKDTSTQQITQAAILYLEKLKSIFRKSRIFAITPIWTNIEDQKKSSGTIQDVRNIIEKAAKKAGCTVINGLSLVPNNNFYFVDGIHPNETGHLVYGVNLACAIQEQLK
ncbi:MAG: SGNH/GDSL hydrolase family protein, partial [Candidatus Ratteibacteria bacterium]